MPAIASSHADDSPNLKITPPLIRWVCFSTALGLFTLIIAMFTLFDPLMGYQMCVICLGQRLLLLALALGIGLYPALLCRTKHPHRLPVFLALLAQFGAGLSAYHGYLIGIQSDDACPLMLHATAASPLQRLWQHFEWIPCASEQTSLLSVPLPLWSMGLFLILACFCLWLAGHSSTENTP